MENFVVSARKYRPATFRSVVGQQHVTTTLQNAIVSHHLAQAFLFCGPRGVGKTTCARILAKTINCTNLTPEAEACNECESCRAFNQNASFNVHELDAASNNSVEDIRSLVEQVRYAPQAGRYKIYIIDEVHMLSNAAFNAFLKTLEEPPSYAIFILATTERHKIIPTILSRCQIFDFNRIRVEDIRKHLRYVATQEHIAAEDDALHLLAQKADGGLRDALSMFDQMVTFSGHNLTYKDVVQNLHVLDYEYYFRLVDALLTENLSAALLLLDEVMQNGFDLHNFVVGAAEHLRGLLVCKDTVTVQLLEVSEGIRARYVQQAQASPLAFLLSALNLVSQCDREFKQAKNQRLHVELTLMKLAYLNGAVQFARDLGTSNGHATNGEAKKKTSVETGAPVASAPAPVPSVPVVGAAPAVESAPRVAPPVAAPAPRPMAPPQPVAPRPVATVSAPAAPEESVPVESGVEELHETPSIEDEEADIPTVHHQVVDTSPHVDIGAPSVAGHEPTTTRLPPPPPGMQKPLPTTAKLPGLASKIPSLKDLKAQVTQQMSAAKATPVADDEPSGPVTGLPVIDEEVLQKAWNDIKEDRRAQDRMSEYIVLNRPVTVDDQHVIRLAVDNPIQIDQFNAFRSEFLTELRQRTGYPRLNVHPVLMEQAPTARKLYTSADKFEYLADKFPILLDMKQKLGLDTDF
ncbi:DNA polymerase III subunit gamma/tau [Hymenobacter crusticola]|uniref:DNA polymerase III subunit gamma/tau n=1 Tax=Hymenobacter crusticola TaxID=1770526 RepID=A0A243W8A2_9BACT|nr:DNA polymerase III subunit gamma/tau [Hymenobacter crusticola]OUJ71394.1 DNA polymerase III subunit gamma/tau [Hymenobacter crusticola]